jgi:hypothetical protein
MDIKKIISKTKVEIKSLTMKAGGFRKIYFLKSPIELFGVIIRTVGGSLCYKVLQYDSEEDRIKQLNHVRDYFRIEGFKEDCYVGNQSLNQPAVRLI